MPTPRLRVHCLLETSDSQPPLRGWLARRFRQAAALAGVTAGEITLAVVGDARMSEIHLRHLGIAGPTDVITFDLRENLDDLVEGDLVICLDEARRQSEARGHATRLEVLLYAVHGLLHLRGYDDHRAQDAAAMHAEEDKILTRMGLGSIYAPPPLDGKSPKGHTAPPKRSRGPVR